MTVMPNHALANPAIALWLQAESIADRPALNLRRLAMSRGLIALLFVWLAAAYPLAATPIVDDALLLVVRKTLPNRLLKNRVIFVRTVFRHG